jgi:transposase-like protein
VFQAQAVRRVTEPAHGVAEVARDLDLSESVLRAREPAPAAEGERALPGKGHPPALGEEPRWLRAQNQRLRAGRAASADQEQD